MENFITTLLGCSVSMSALTLLYIFFTPVLIKRYREKWLYYVWLVVVAGSLIPFRPQLNVMPVFSIGSVIRAAEEAQIPAALLIMGENIYYAAPLVSWTAIAAVWLAGVIAFLLYHAAKYYLFIKMTNRWSVRVTDEQTLILLQTLKKEMNITKSFGLFVCESAGSPMLIGLLKPRILIPTAEIAQDELGYILKHELVHYKRNDILYKFLVLTATAANWFNPVIYLAAKQISVLCEMSCDAEVIKNEDANSRQFYCETIISVVKYKSKLKTALSTNCYSGKNGMKKRISAIMSMKGKKAGVAVACMALVAALASGLFFAVSNPVYVSVSKGELALEEETPAASNNVYDSVSDGKLALEEASSVNALNPVYVSIRKGDLTLEESPSGAGETELASIRDVTEKTGANAAWDEATYTVTMQTVTMQNDNMAISLILNNENSHYHITDTGNEKTLAVHTQFEDEILEVPIQLTLGREK
ncbi:MAG: M56 family metallopeptidase [Clostridiales bacterium]|jgi:beta-lactamase regulating signal transducer with metallopeptidase domain|nr:M56 family metallopeptidase [Clostridiales bacterium]